MAERGRRRPKRKRGRPREEEQGFQKEKIVGDEREKGDSTWFFSGEGEGEGSEGWPVAAAWGEEVKVKEVAGLVPALVLA